MTENYIGADVDCRTTVLAVRRNNKVVRRLTVPTTIPSLIAALRSIRRPRILVIEEGNMAGWLYRSLRDEVDEMVVCDPRRNALITKDGDKSNPIDADKLSELLAGEHLRPVYHRRDEDRVVFKQWVSLYDDRVRDAVRQVNKIRGRCRMYGVWPPRGAVRNAKVRTGWLEGMEPQALAAQVRLLFLGFDTAVRQVDRARQEVARRSKAYEVIERWQKIPGVGPVRATTFFAYMDTPFRFANRQKRWKYCGVGLVRKASGTDKRGREKPGKVKLELAANRRLKDAVLGGAISAIGQGNNVFSDVYHRMRSQGISDSNARHTVARKLIDKMTAMWKTGERFQPDLA
jgi:transposase